MLRLIALLLAGGLLAGTPLTELSAADEAVETETAAADTGLLGQLKQLEKRANDAFGGLNSTLESFMFYPVPVLPSSQQIAKLSPGIPAAVGTEYLIEFDGTRVEYKSADGDRIAAVHAGLIAAWEAAGLADKATLYRADGGNSLAVSVSGSESFRVKTVFAGDEKAAESAPTGRVPAAVLWLVFGAVFFTFRMGFINFRAFRHAIDVVRGKFDVAGDEGEVSHFQALTAALSATVGLGNIAGVAIAVSLGGPGATFWMILAGLLGMSSKFVECTLGQKFREVRPDGSVMGGAMFYLSRGLEGQGFGPLGKVLALLFAVLCVGGSFAGGNAFQVNQSLNAVQETVPLFARMPWLYGLMMTVLVGVVIIGGIRRIAATAEKIVPVMCGVFVLAALVILIKNMAAVPAAFGAIISGAFSAKAIYGGGMGVLVTGFQRAAFSNEAGVGSAAIAHSAARTEYPVREGIVALLEPFIDTVVVCTMTALVIVVTGAYSNPEFESLRLAKEGAALTSRAMSNEIANFDYILSVAVMLFAYSTMISWSYYGERCWAYLFGERWSMAYKLLFLVFVFLGSIVSATNILNFGDLMILGMAFPNILGVLFLTGIVKRDLDDYWRRLKSGEIHESVQS